MENDTASLYELLLSKIKEYEAKTKERFVIYTVGESTHVTHAFQITSRTTDHIIDTIAAKFGQNIQVYLPPSFFDISVRQTRQTTTETYKLKEPFFRFVDRDSAKKIVFGTKEIQTYPLRTGAILSKEFLKILDQSETSPNSSDIIFHVEL